MYELKIDVKTRHDTKTKKYGYELNKVLVVNPRIDEISLRKEKLLELISDITLVEQQLDFINELNELNIEYKPLIDKYEEDVKLYNVDLFDGKIFVTEEETTQHKGLIKQSYLDAIDKGYKIELTQEQVDDLNA